LQQGDDVPVQFERTGQEVVFGQQVLEAGRMGVQPLRPGQPQPPDRGILGIAIDRAGEQQTTQQQHGPQRQAPARPAAGPEQVDEVGGCWHGGPETF
jgi:hypothetical protein